MRRLFRHLLGGWLCSLSFFLERYRLMGKVSLLFGAFEWVLEIAYRSTRFPFDGVWSVQRDVVGVGLIKVSRDKRQSVGGRHGREISKRGTWGKRMTCGRSGCPIGAAVGRTLQADDCLRRSIRSAGHLVLSKPTTAAPPTRSPAAKDRRRVHMFRGETTVSSRRGTSLVLLLFLTPIDSRRKVCTQSQ